jgi:hypothetical protein
MKNKGLIFGGIAVVAVIGGAMWYSKAKKDGKLPAWLSADGEWNRAAGDCYKNNAGGYDCFGKDGFVKSGSTLKEAQDKAAGMVSRGQTFGGSFNRKAVSSKAKMF